MKSPYEIAFVECNGEATCPSEYHRKACPSLPPLDPDADVFCSGCGTLMVKTISGYQCPVEDWHDICSLDFCGVETGSSCGLREGYNGTITEALPHLRGEDV